MTIPPEHRIGKFYRFKPRSQWPADDQRVLPQDKLYYTHPAIVIGHTKGGLLHVITTTHTPLASHAYAPLQFPNPKLDIPPLIMKRWFEDPRKVYVTLSNRKTFTEEIFTEFRDERTGVQYELSKGSRKRLRKLVEGYEISKLYNTLPPASSLQPTKKAGNKAAKKIAPPPAQVMKPKSSPVAAIKTDTVATNERSLDVQDIKAGLAGLKLAVAALEALCEELEAGHGAVATSEVEASVSAVPPAVMSGAPALDGNLDSSSATAEPSEMTSTEDKECAASRLSGSTRSSTRSRIQKWFSRLWKKRTGLSLASM